MAAGPTPRPSRANRFGTWVRTRFTGAGRGTAAAGARRLIALVFYAVLVIGALFVGLIAVKWLANTGPVQAVWSNPLNWGDDDSDNGNDDEDVISVDSEKDAAKYFGGNKNDWREAKDSDGLGWVYKGPKTNLHIPEGFRVDYPNHSCAEPKSEKNTGGVYGDDDVKNITKATVWDVSADEESACPSTSKFATEIAAAAPPPGQTPTSGQSSMGCGDKNVGAIQALIGLSVVCLGTEYDAYTWRSVPLKVDATCPEGFICTLHLAEGDKIIVTQTPGKYSIVAGTFRQIKSYPTGDAVHNACELLIKEKAFGASQTPKFDVFPHGFTCDGTKLTKTDTPAEFATADLTKQASADLIAKVVGGSSSNWKELPDTNGKGWKYIGPAVSLTAPQGTRIDHPTGTANAGQSVTAGVATLWILN